ncbi:hypothetical protein HAX54_048239 [Datura stramonium]|uniref:Uncharacterized protein n=1 Tax=Datura stramonium TaxID=4076 RepID=A0ABS8WKY9_DATST|nr:hypothetical protein [Datura stramonium]
MPAYIVLCYIMVVGVGCWGHDLVIAEAEGPRVDEAIDGSCGTVWYARSSVALGAVMPLVWGVTSCLRDMEVMRTATRYVGARERQWHNRVECGTNITGEGTYGHSHRAQPTGLSRPRGEDTHTARLGCATLTLSSFLHASSSKLIP